MYGSNGSRTLSSPSNNLTDINLFPSPTILQLRVQSPLLYNFSLFYHNEYSLSHNLTYIQPRLIPLNVMTHKVMNVHNGLNGRKFKAPNTHNWNFIKPLRISNSTIKHMCMCNKLMEKKSGNGVSMNALTHERVHILVSVHVFLMW
jgi:hypothetical protein